MFYLLVTAVFGLWLLREFVVGLKGRRVGSAPHCRACEFNLIGRPADSMRCSECGADLSESAAIVIGERQRSRVRVALSGSALACAGGIFAWISVVLLVNYPWIHLCPVSRLIANFDGPSSQKRFNAFTELERRVAIPEGLNSANASAVVEKLLAMHGDPSKKWSGWSSDLFHDADRGGQVNSEQLQRFLGQCIADIDGPSGTRRTDSVGELYRRLTAPGGIDSASRRSLIETLLAIHGDESRTWDRFNDDLLEGAAGAGQISDEQLQRLIGQSVKMRLETHPSIRRGETMILTVGVEFVRMPFGLGGHFEQGNVLLNEKAILYHFERDGIVGTDRHVGSFVSRFITRPEKGALAAVPDGPVSVEFAATFSLFVNRPFTSHRVEFSRQIMTRARLAPADATTDLFIVDKNRRTPADYGILDVMVTHDDLDPRVAGKLLIEPRIQSPPISLAMDVLVRPAGHTELPWRNMGPAGMLQVPKGASDTRYYLDGDGHSIDCSNVDLLFRPSQDAADRFDIASSAYCGSELLLPSVPVRAADSVLRFVTDPSLRRQVEAAVRVGPITGGPKSYTLVVNFGATPVTLNMDCIARVGSREILVKGHMRWGSGDARAFAGPTWNLSLVLPDGLDHAETVDVILRPQPEIGERPGADTNPWGEEIMFRNLPLPHRPAP